MKIKITSTYTNMISKIDEQKKTPYKNKTKESALKTTKREVLSEQKCNKNKIDNKTKNKQETE